MVDIWWLEAPDPNVQLIFHKPNMAAPVFPRFLPTTHPFGC